MKRIRVIRYGLGFGLGALLAVLAPHPAAEALTECRGDCCSCADTNGNSCDCQGGDCTVGLGGTMFCHQSLETCGHEGGCFCIC
jgi:hypothetical protein